MIDPISNFLYCYWWKQLCVCINHLFLWVQMICILYKKNLHHLWNYNLHDTHLLIYINHLNLNGYIFSFGGITLIAQEYISIIYIIIIIVEIFSTYNFINKSKISLLELLFCWNIKHFLFFFESMVPNIEIRN